jgi:hypothetical protein
MIKLDFYLNDQNVIDRLVTEWEKYGSNFVIAYDFDDTVYDYHKKGRTYNDVVKLLGDCKLFGAHLVVFTANPEKNYPKITQYLMDNDIPFDAINETPEFIPIDIGNKKIYFNIFLDDRAGLSSSYYCLSEALEIMRDKKKDGELVD